MQMKPDTQMDNRWLQIIKSGESPLPSRITMPSYPNLCYSFGVRFRNLLAPAEATHW